MTSRPSALRLLAADEADIPVLSALLQDALASPDTIHWSRRSRRLTLIVSRLRREPGVTARERVQSALTVRGVERVLARALGDSPGKTPLVLLALTVTPAGETPWRTLELAFAGQDAPSLRVLVETIDLTLEDISAGWTAAGGEPRHD